MFPRQYFPGRYFPPRYFPQWIFFEADTTLYVLVEEDNFLAIVDEETEFATYFSVDNLVDELGETLVDELGEELVVITENTGNVYVVFVEPDDFGIIVEEDT